MAAGRHGSNMSKPVDLAGGVNLGSRVIGPGHPVFIIAEAGVNHNGQMELARRLVDAAAAAGVDAVKFQTFKAEKVVSSGAPQATYQMKNTGVEETQLAMIRRLELDAERTAELGEYCSSVGIEFLSTPFDEESAELLQALGVPAFKVGSGELTNHRFLKYLAEKGLPLIVSTGMASMEETEAAVAAIRGAGGRGLCLLHCVSAYPAPPEESNLRSMDTLRRNFHVPVGWSDHTLGLHVTVAAVALGASLVEKHFTLDRSLPGPDHAASLEPQELAALVRQVREVESALGDGVKRCMPSEENTAAVARRSVHTAADLPAGHVIGPDDLLLLRPGTGIGAHEVEKLVGRRTLRRIPAGTMLSWSDIEEEE